MSVKENNRLLATVSSKCAKILAFWVGCAGDILSGNKWCATCSCKKESVGYRTRISDWQGVKRYVADYFSGNKHKILRRMNQEKQNSK